MRGRHSAAILTMMDLTETIASTLDEYVTLAVRLRRARRTGKGYRKRLPIISILFIETELVFQLLRISLKKLF